MSDSATSGAPAPHIPRVGKAARRADEAGFWSLRALAIDLAQAASGQIWTDYNLHDPGVTLLEAVCFALTELVYQADFDVADHLCGSDGQIDFERQALFTPPEIFPCRATTAADLRCVVLDQTPGLRDVRLIRPTGPADIGLHRLSLLLSDRNETPWDEIAAQARAAYRRQRGLGEDIDEAVGQIEVKLCSLSLDAGLEGARDPVDALAEIFEVCAGFIARTPPVHGLEELRRAGRSLEQIFTGPAAVSGFIDQADLSAGVVDPAHPELGPRDEVSLNDLRGQLLNIEGVVSISALSLRLDGGEPQTRVFAWYGDQWVPRLRTPPPPGSDSDSAANAAVLGAIRLTRRGAVIKVDAQDVAERYADRLAGQASGRRPPDNPADHIPLPRGVYRPAAPYYSVRHHFPPLYGLGDEGPPEGADPDRALHALQFKTYLALFDQLLANSASQMRRIRDLFSPDESLAHSYWPEVLDDQSLPGVEALYGGKTIRQVHDQVFDKYDDATDRRQRVLDYLLSLYGETFPQGTLRQFLDYLDSEEQASALIENKADYLKRTVVLGRDRAAGFDYAAPLWGSADHTPGVQLRIALLVGFARPYARRLTGALIQDGQDLGVALFGPAQEPEASAPPPRFFQTVRERRRDVRPLEWPVGRRPSLTNDEAERALGGRAVAPAALLPIAVDRQRYGWRPDGEGRGGRLLLGPDHRDEWWDLGGFGDEREAGRVATWIRHRMLVRTEECEGLHVVEHILLRPRAGPAAQDTHALRVTLVLPCWTARTARHEFRDFAEETVRINGPAHVAVRCLWLEIDAMAQFEQAYAHWLELLRGHCQQPGNAAALDEAARAVVDLVSPAWPPGRSGAG